MHNKIFRNSVVNVSSLSFRSIALASLLFPSRPSPSHSATSLSTSSQRIACLRHFVIPRMSVTDKLSSSGIIHKVVIMSFLPLSEIGLLCLGNWAGQQGRGNWSTWRNPHSHLWTRESDWIASKWTSIKLVWFLFKRPWKHLHCKLVLHRWDWIKQKLLAVRRLCKPQCYPPSYFLLPINHSQVITNSGTNINHVIYYLRCSILQQLCILR